MLPLPLLGLAAAPRAAHPAGEAYQKVAANKGAAGIDDQSIGDFELDLKNNVYRVVESDEFG